MSFLNPLGKQFKFNGISCDRECMVLNNKAPMVMVLPWGRKSLKSDSYALDEAFEITAQK